jgi:hypothetical protein
VSALHGELLARNDSIHPQRNCLLHRKLLTPKHCCSNFPHFFYTDKQFYVTPTFQTTLSQYERQHFITFRAIFIP